MFVLVMLIFYRTLIDQASSSDVWPILFGLVILQQTLFCYPDKRRNGFFKSEREESVRQQEWIILSVSALL